MVIALAILFAELSYRFYEKRAAILFKKILFLRPKAPDEPKTPDEPKAPDEPKTRDDLKATDKDMVTG